jgi:hypothetical protein
MLDSNYHIAADSTIAFLQLVLEVEELFLYIRELLLQVLPVHSPAISDASVGHRSFPDNWGTRTVYGHC